MRGSWGDRKFPNEGHSWKFPSGLTCDVRVAQAAAASRCSEVGGDGVRVLHTSTNKGDDPLVGW